MPDSPYKADGEHDEDCQFPGECLMPGQHFPLTVAGKGWRRSSRFLRLFAGRKDLWFLGVADEP